MGQEGHWVTLRVTTCPLCSGLSPLLPSLSHVWVIMHVHACTHTLSFAYVLLEPSSPSPTP